MKKEYARYMSSVQLYLLKKQKNDIFVLLQQRTKDSWAPLQWEAGACGHVDHGESPTQALVHEAKEELEIKIEEKNLKFISVVFKNLKNTKYKDDYAYYNFSFYCEKWTGIPKIGEKDNIVQIKWFNIKKLPKDIIEDRKISIQNFVNNIKYCEYLVPKKK